MNNQKNKTMSCDLPRKDSAIKAIYCLMWKKQKKDRPLWLIKEVETS